MVLRPANNDIDEQHFVGFPQWAALWDGPYSDICGVAATCGLQGCLTKVSAIMCRPFSLWFVVRSL